MTAQSQEELLAAHLEQQNIDVILISPVSVDIFLYKFLLSELLIFFKGN